MDKCVKDKLKKMEELNKAIKSCNDNKIAIDLQKELVELLLSSFKDKKVLDQVVKNSTKKK